MPFKPVADEFDFPELDNPRIPWEEWGPQEQERRLIEAIGPRVYAHLKYLHPDETEE
jgi:hypothetical protein